MRSLLLRTLNGALEYLNLKIVRTVQPQLHYYSVDHRPRRPLYLNIGAGNWAHPIWHNLENPVEGYGKSTAQDIHVIHDLTSGQPLLLEDDSLEAAYSSHVIEHLNDEYCRQLFREMHRCLKSGGYIRLVCPDANVYFDGYQRSDETVFKGIGESSY